MVNSRLLKIALFATGLSGIVAEYILSTLATYFIGDSVIQWTLIVSIMLFSMGLGSRLSRNINDNLLVNFITIEFVLSVLVGFVSVITYLTSVWLADNALVIYSLSICIGILIGMEIPLVIRINDKFEELRVNVSSVMENDYYGSLVGGMFFAFIGLPFLGLSYTPFLLSFVNFSVAILLIIRLRKVLEKHTRIKVYLSGVAVGIFLISGWILADKAITYGDEKRYRDNIIFTEQSKYQKIVITQNKNGFWLFINGNQQLSSVDEHLYHEPLVHPAMKLAVYPQNILILGGGDGIAVNEILKYEEVKTIKLVDLDPAMTNLGLTHPLLTKLNHDALSNPKVEIINKDGFNYLEQDSSFYDLIIVDLPDPKTVDINRLYTREFYQLCFSRLRKNGVVVTQAGSPYFAPTAFESVYKTIKSAGFTAGKLHNTVPSLGEWGWVLGSKSIHQDSLKKILQNLNFKDIDTRWITKESMIYMTEFGKKALNRKDPISKINTIQDPVLYRYYLRGHWDIY